MQQQIELHQQQQYANDGYNTEGYATDGYGGDGYNYASNGGLAYLVSCFFICITICLKE